MEFYFGVTGVFVVIGFLSLVDMLLEAYDNWKERKEFIEHYTLEEKELLDYVTQEAIEVYNNQKEKSRRVEL